MSDNTSDSEQIQYKKCSKCGEIKNLSEFGKNSAGVNGKRPDCVECHRKTGRDSYKKNKNKIRGEIYAWRERNPEKFERSKRNYHLKTRYKISIDEYESLLNSQNGVCAICNKTSTTRRLHVDHDHVTGRVRGLLCFNCNKKLGVIETFMEAALDYLEKHAR